MARRITFATLLGLKIWGGPKGRYSSAQATGLGVGFPKQHADCRDAIIDDIMPQSLYRILIQLVLSIPDRRVISGKNKKT